MKETSADPAGVLLSDAARLLAGITASKWTACEIGEADARFIAAAPRLVRGLLEENARLEIEFGGQVEALRLKLGAAEAASLRGAKLYFDLKQELATVRAALQTYGQHTVDCDAAAWNITIGTRLEGTGPDCTCGFSALLIPVVTEVR